MVAVLVTILKIKVLELRASVEKILYAKNPVEIRKIKLWSAAILNMAAMLAANLKIQIHEFGASVEKILYARKSRRNTEILTLVSGHFEYGSHVGGHFENTNS